MQKKAKVSSVKTLILIVIFVIIIIIIVTQNANQEKEKNISITMALINEPKQNVVDLKEQNKVKEYLPSREDWKLIIVNKENYVPQDYQVDLAEIENGFKVDKRIVKSLSNMLKDMRREGLSPWICSAYRSSERQKKLFNNKVIYYQKQGYSGKSASEKASQWIAIPGTSEHEIGLSVDIVSKDYQLLDKNQENTLEQKWLMKHCHQYGFIMRYPTDKKQITKIDYEPWHYRYVGIENATFIKKNKFCLEEYIEYLKTEE